MLWLVVLCRCCVLRFVVALGWLCLYGLLMDYLVSYVDIDCRLLLAVCCCCGLWIVFGGVVILWVLCFEY